MNFCNKKLLYQLNQRQNIGTSISFWYKILLSFNKKHDFTDAKVNFLTRRRIFNQKSINKLPILFK